VGGLLNTVFDWDYDDFHPPAKRNGFVFFQSDLIAVESALGRALDLWQQSPALFEKLALQGMNCDYSWHQPGEQYLDVYEHIRHK
jgi:starch synthase